MELAALLEQHKQQLAAHEEKAGTVSRDLAATTAATSMVAESIGAGDRASTPKESQQKIKKLELQVGLTETGTRCVAGLAPLKSTRSAAGWLKEGLTVVSLFSGSHDSPEAKGSRFLEGRSGLATRSLSVW